MSKNRESSFPDPEQPGGIDELTRSFPKGIGVTHPGLIDERRAHRIRKAAKAAEEIAPGVIIPDEADPSDLSPSDLESVKRASEEIDRVANPEENPRRE